MSSTRILRSDLGGEQQQFPVSATGLVSSSYNSDSDELLRIQREFLGYVSAQRSKKGFLVLEREGETFVVDVSPARTSRYFEEGRAKVLRRLRRRLSGRRRGGGVFLTLTFSREVSLLGAWDSVAWCCSRFMDRLNKWRMRRGAVRSLVYSVHLEAHRDGYPHLHLWFPGLRWLAPLSVIDRCWEWGLTNVRLVRSGSVVCYLTRYVSRVKYWPLVSLALLWWFRRRLYNVSPSMYRVREWSEVRFVGFVRSWCEAVHLALCVVGGDGECSSFCYACGFG